MAAVALVDPAGHAKPAVQFAVQDDSVKPEVDPYRPGSQGPVHAAEGAASTLPYVPAGHGLQTDAPPRENWPAGQALANRDMEFGVHVYPGAHWATVWLHWDRVRNLVASGAMVATHVGSSPSSRLLHVLRYLQRC